VTIACSGKACPFRAKTLTGATVAAGRLFKRALKPGAVIEVRITAPNAIGSVTRYKIRRGKQPSRTERAAR
jgi:hypothetical protein